MFDAINHFLVNLLDWVFGWILFLPRDATLFIVAVFTALIINYIRKWVTDQVWLRQASEDETRLNELIGEDKKRGDRDAVKRRKDTQNAIKIKSMRFEGLALLWALAPFMILFTWALGRVVYMPTAVGETVELRAYIPKTDIGQIIHLAPEPGIDATNGWVQTVVADSLPATTSLWDRADTWLTDKLSTPAPLEGVAVWKIVAHDDKPHVLKIRYAGHTYEQRFIAGHRQYEPPQNISGDAPVTGIVTGTEVMLTPRRLFGFVGSISLLFLEPWLVAYFLIAIPFVYILKSLCKIF